MRLFRFAAMIAAAFLTVPATAQRVQTIPAAQPLTGAEKLPAVQGSGCAANASPCTTVTISPSQLATWLAPRFETQDTDLDAIAALSTQPFGRSALTQADATSFRSLLGVTATGMDTAYLLRANNLSGLADVPTARTNLGLGSAATYAVGSSGTTVPLLSSSVTWSGAQTINQGAQVNVPVLTLTNLGRGSSGVVMLQSTGGRLQIGDGGDAQPWLVYSENRAMDFSANNNAYTNTAYTFQFRNMNADARSVIRAKQNNSTATGNLIEGVDSTDAIKFRVSVAGEVLATRYCYTATVCDYAGSGSPLGKVTAAIGSTYRRTDGGSAITFYVKESGTDASGWAAK